MKLNVNVNEWGTELLFLRQPRSLSQMLTFRRGEMASAIETIVLLKWTFILKSHHLSDSEWTPPNGHNAYCVQSFSEISYLRRRMKALAQMLLETFINWPRGLVLESLVGLGTVNMTCGKLPIYNTLRHRHGRSDCPRGIEKQMAGELALITQKSSGHRMKTPPDRLDLTRQGSYQKTQREQRG